VYNSQFIFAAVQCVLHNAPYIQYYGIAFIRTLTQPYSSSTVTNCKRNYRVQWSFSSWLEN